MSKLGSLYLRLGEPEGETHGCCELSDWAADLIEQQAKRIAELERLNLSFAQNEQKVEQQAAEIAILSQKNPNGERNPAPGDPCGRSCEGQAYRIELRQALDKVEQYESEMRALASWLGAGGYNATEVTPKVLAEKIRWGVDHIVRVESNRRDAVIKQQAKEIESLQEELQRYKNLEALNARIDGYFGNNRI